MTVFNKALMGLKLEEILNAYDRLEKELKNELPSEKEHY